MLRVGPGFDLHEDEGFAVPGDDVDFPPSPAEAPDEDGPAFFLEKADGGRFAFAA
jgi:hypothetical protein